jgi:hypothetical protein
MKRFKKIELVIAILISLVLFSCTDEDGNLDMGDDRDAFLGTWDVTEACSKDSYSVTIVKDPSNSSQVIIQNFWLIGYNERPPYAIIAGSTITIPNQFMCYNNSNEVSGSGSIDKNTIELDYTVNDGADLWDCTATYEKP